MVKGRALGNYLDTPLIFSAVRNPASPNIAKVNSNIASSGNSGAPRCGANHCKIGLITKANKKPSPQTHIKNGLAPATNVDLCCAWTLFISACAI